jgi:hypothetical protein
MWGLTALVRKIIWVSPYITSSNFKAFWTPPLVINRHHALNPLPFDYVIIHEAGKRLQSTLIINHLAHEVYKPTIVTI